MQKAIIYILIAQISLSLNGQIIADHTIIDKFDEIPQAYIDEVKKMWLVVPGESHSVAYETGLASLESLYSTFVVNVTEEGTPEAYTTAHLRVSRATWGDISNESGWIYDYGEEDWCCYSNYELNPAAVARTKAGITYCNTNNLTIAAMGFGWCYDDGLWESYLTATQQYIDFCTVNGYSTKIFFTTGPVDDYMATGESGYNNYIRWEYIRDYVDQDASRILFDYADILSYNDDGELSIATWDGHTYPVIHPDNEEGTYTGHIGSVGAIRLAKAMWWMLARIAGWDGGTSVPVTSVTVIGEGGATTIDIDGGTLQLSANVLPENATDKTVTWSIQNGTGQGTINASGLVTAIADGTVTATATANDGSGISGSLTITISNQVIPVTSITVTGEEDATTIDVDGGTLQLSANVLPDDATDKTITWSIQNGTGEATINASGLVIAIADGTVTATATANDGSGISGNLTITISNQVIPVTSITVTGEEDATTIDTDGGTLQLSANVLPIDATDKTVTWSLTNGTGEATIDASGLVTAVANGTVTAIATANDGSDVSGNLIITISNQIVTVSSIAVSGEGGASIITTEGGTLQLFAIVLPENATDKTVTWSLTNGTGEATINVSGLVTAVTNGTVTAIATANDGSGVSGSLIITISSQMIPVTSITVTGEGGETTIDTYEGTLQLSTYVLPENATNKTITWSIQNETGEATINASGLVTAIANGTVTATATANDGSGVTGSLIITISNQNIPVTSIIVTGEGGATSIDTDEGKLQLSADVLPENATDKTVTWSIQNITGQASISSIGRVTAIDNGTVTAIATANDGSGISGSLNISISNQVIRITSITVTGEGNVTTIDTDGGTLQLNPNVLPDNATNKTVTWSIQNQTGEAMISTAGLVTAVDDGSVIATATANDGSGIYGSLTITISNQIIPVTSITVSQQGGSGSTVDVGNTLQLIANVLPNNATDKTVTWSLTNGTGEATINASGLVIALEEGTVTAIATANDGSGVYGMLEIIILSNSTAVAHIIVYGEDFKTTVDNGGTLQFYTKILPENASNKSVNWTVQNGGTGQASINTSGLLTAIAEGQVTVKATSTDGSEVTGILNIIIGDQIPTSIIDVNSEPVEVEFHQSQITVHMGDNETFKQINIFNILGYRVMNDFLDKGDNTYNIAQLESGIYIILLLGKEKLKTIKIFVP